jgi:hypothetical protein
MPARAGAAASASVRTRSVRSATGVRGMADVAGCGIACCNRRAARKLRDEDDGLGV